MDYEEIKRHLKIESDLEKREQALLERERKITQKETEMKSSEIKPTENMFNFNFNGVRAK